MELKWDLSEMYPSLDALEKDIDKLKALGAALAKFRGTLNSADNVLACFLASDELEKTMDKIGEYLGLSLALDGNNVQIIEKAYSLNSYLEQLARNLTFASIELKKIPSKTLAEWAKLPQFADYNLRLQDIIDTKKHTLSANEEKLMIGASTTNSQGELFDAINNVEIDFGKTIDESGKRVRLTNANYEVLATSSNKKVRKSAVKKFLSAYGKLNQTISINYISHLKADKFEARAYKYRGTLARMLKDNHLPANLPQKVVEFVREYLPLYQEYQLWRKNFMKLDKYESCDTSCKLFDSSISRSYTLCEAVKIIKQALLPLGEDYTAMLDHAIKNNWIDSVIRENKQTGAFSSGCYGLHPYILLTYDGTQNSVSTLAHEFGHAMHSYYSSAAQPYSKHQYKIFVAEVASTVNEIMLADYFITHAQSREEKIIAITEFLNTFVGTVFTQTRYTEFELFAHGEIDAGRPLSYKILNDKTLSLIKEYNGKNVSVLPEAKYHWSIIPHFYNSFYVFQYATGFVSACAIATKLKADKNYKNTYRQFLSAGESKDPCDLLCDAGVDILDKQTYADAFSIFKNYVDMLKEI